MNTLSQALGLEFGHCRFRHGVADLVRGAGLEDLARIEFDHVAARFLGLGNGLEGSEFIKCVCLGTDEPAVLAQVLRDRVGTEVRGKRDGEKGGEAFGVFGIHDMGMRG